MTELNGHVLYDGDCGICQKILGQMSTSFEKRGFAVAALQEEWVAEAIDISGVDLYRDLRVLLVDGTLYSGAEAYRYMMRRIWWTYPVYLVSLVPGFRQFFDWCYRKFADNRHRFSQACALPRSSDKNAPSE